MLTRLFFVGNKWNCVFFFRGATRPYCLNYKTGGRPRAYPPFSWELGVRIENVIFRAKPRG